MTVQQKPENKSFNIAGYDGNKDLADALNTFYSRFDTEDFADDLREICRESALPTKTNLMLNPQDVKAVFQKYKINKSPWPDSITGDCSTAL